MSDNMDEANEILAEYTKECSLIDEGNLFFAATEFKKALESANAEINRLENESDKDGLMLIKLGNEASKMEKNLTDKITSLESENKKLSEQVSELKQINHDLSKELDKHRHGHISEGAKAIKLAEQLESANAEIERLNDEVKYFPSLTEQRNLHELVRSLKSENARLRAALERISKHLSKEADIAGKALSGEGKEG